MVRAIESGFGETFSATESVLIKGRAWSNGNVVQQIASHTVIPITVVAAAALDVLAHTLLAVGKTVGFAVNAVAFVVSLSYIDIHASLTPSQIFKHAYRTAVTVAFVVVAAPLSIFSSSTALNLAQALGLADSDKPLGFFKAIWEGIPAGGNSFSAVSAKASYVTKEIFFGIGNGVKSAACWSGSQVKKLTWDSENRVALAVIGAGLVLGYAAAVWKMGNDILAPAAFVLDHVKAAPAAIYDNAVSTYNRVWNWVRPQEKTYWEQGMNFASDYNLVYGLVGIVGLAALYKWTGPCVRGTSKCCGTVNRVRSDWAEKRAEARERARFDAEAKKNKSGELPA